jgi:hypothetical protein
MTGKGKVQGSGACMCIYSVGEKYPPPFRLLVGEKYGGCGGGGVCVGGGGRGGVGEDYHKDLLDASHL